MFSFLAAIAFLSSDPGPTAHFEAFSQALEERGLECCWASPNTPLPEGTSHLVTDLSARSLATLTQSPPAENIRVFAYYDNPEEDLPGDYLETAGKVIAFAERVLFANQNLAGRSLFPKRDFGIGYSPLPEKAAALPANADRSAFLSRHQVKERGQKLAFYFGGATQTHRLYALPHFLHLLSEAREELSDYTFVVQIHPRSTQDRSTVEKWKEQKGVYLPELIISEASFEEAVAIADHALYYQTSASPLFLLSGIPTIQVGQWPRKDLLVDQGFCKGTVTSAEFIEGLSQEELPLNREALLEELGICNNWRENLYNSLLEK